MRPNYDIITAIIAKTHDVASNREFDDPLIWADDVYFNYTTYI